MAITPQEMVAKLAGVQPGTEVFVSYLAGRPARERARREARKADTHYDRPIPKRWFQGRLEAAWITKKGEPVMTVLSTTRYNEQDPRAEAHYRTFNPALGTMLTLEVL
jgi:hypothetical protein